ncbi:hypothetical protein GCM10027037_14740 [Mucilaginibacter koreensis]
MNDLQLYINNELADLSDDSPIALTFQINNLAEVKNQQGHTSNQFKLPLTQRNRALLGFPDEISFTNNLPYTQYQCKVIQDGLEIIPFGIGELNSIEQDTANFTVLSGNVDFFDSIDGKLYEMGDKASSWGAKQLWKPYDHQWTLQNVVNSQTKTEGWIWPVVDYGKIAADFSGIPQIDVRNLRPGFFLHSAIDLLMAATGYKAQGRLLSDPLYRKLIVQFSNDNFTHGTDYQNAVDDSSVIISSSQPQDFNQYTVNHSPYNRVLFTNTVSLSKGVFDISRRSYTAPEHMKATITLNYDVKVRSNTNNKGAVVRLFIRANPPGGGPYIDYSISEKHGATGKWGDFSEYKKQTLSAEVDLLKGTEVLVTYSIEQYTEGILTKAEFSIINKKEDVLYTHTVQCERIFPDIGQKDLLKDTLQRFGIVCQADNINRTVTFASFRDIVNNIPIARNWTGKCLNQGKTISFQLGGYAQLNYLKYKDDDNVKPAGLANSQIKVADTTLAATADLFESQFAPTLNRYWIGGTIAQISKIEKDGDNDDFSISTQPRILIDEKLDLRKQGDRSVRFTDGSASSITVNDTLSVPYFDKPGGQYSLLYDRLRLQYYPELEKILSRSKKVVRYFLLTPRDILELDLLIPVYLGQDNAYYYINKIDSWRKGQPTKVELVLLG